MMVDDAEHPFWGMKAESGQAEVLEGPTRGEWKLHAVGVEGNADGIAFPVGGGDVVGRRGLQESATRRPGRDRAVA